jgi:hypothetical protein
MAARIVVLYSPNRPPEERKYRGRLQGRSSHKQENSDPVMQHGYASSITYRVVAR